MSIDLSREFLKDVCYLRPTGAFEYTGGTVTSSNGDMLQASGASAPASANFRIENSGAIPFLLQGFRIRYGANGYTGTGSVTILGEVFNEVGQSDINGVYRTLDFAPANGVGVVFNVGDAHNSLGASNHGALTGGFQGPVLTGYGGDNIFPAGNIARAELDIVGGVAVTEEVTVRTYEDDTLAVVDRDANTITPLASLPGDWTLCPPALDEFGEVVTATAPFTTTNGTAVAAGEDYLLFPNDETWATGTAADNKTTFATTLADLDLFAFPPADPPGVPANPIAGDTHIERFNNGMSYHTYNGTAWVFNIFQSSDDRRFTVRSEVPLEYVEGSLAGPQNPPANPSQGDVHLEYYANALVFFNYQASGPGAGWDGNNITFVPLSAEDDAIEVRLDGAFALPTPVEGEVHHFAVEALPVSITTTGGEPISTPDLSLLSVGDQLTALPQLLPVFSATGTPISLAQPDGQPNSVSAVLIPGVVEFSRGNAGGLLNTITQSGNNGGQVIVDDVEWFYDPGNTSLPIAPTSSSDTATPTTTSMSTAFDGAIGDEILGTNSWIRVISTGQIFQLTFTNWQQGGGGGFAFTATEMTDQAVLGWSVRKTTGVHSVTGTAVDTSDPLNPVINLVPEKHVLSSFSNLGTTAERVLVDGVPFLCMEDGGATFVSYISADVITPRDVTAPVYVDFTVKRATSPQPDSTFTHLSNFSAIFQTFTFNVETGAASVSSSGTVADPVIELVDVGQDEIRFVVQFSEMAGSFQETWRFRPAGDADINAAGTVYVKDGAFEVTTENPVTSGGLQGTSPARFKATRLAGQSIPIAVDTKLTGWVANQDTAGAFANDDFVAPADGEYHLSAAVRLDPQNFAQINSESILIVLVDGVQVMRGGVAVVGGTFFSGDDFLYGNVSGDLTLTAGQAVSLEIRNGLNNAANVNANDAITYWHMRQLPSGNVTVTTTLATLESPNGTSWAISVDNTGAITTTAV